MAIVSALYRCPLKSCAGVPLQSSRVEARGLQYDRRWAVVDADDRIMTGRDHPGLLQLSVRPTPAGITPGSPDDQIAVRYDDLEERVDTVTLCVYHGGPKFRPEIRR